MYDVQFMLLFFILQVIRVKSVEQELDSGVFVVYGVVWGVGYDGVSEGGLPVYGCFEWSGGFMYGHVEVVQGLVFF